MHRMCEQCYIKLDEDDLELLCHIIDVCPQILDEVTQMGPDLELPQILNDEDTQILDVNDEGAQTLDVIPCDISADLVDEATCQAPTPRSPLESRHN